MATDGVVQIDVGGGLWGIVLDNRYGVMWVDINGVVWVTIVSNLSCGSFTQSSLIAAVNHSRVLVTVVSILRDPRLRFDWFYRELWVSFAIPWLPGKGYSGIEIWHRLIAKEKLRI